MERCDICRIQAATTTRKAVPVKWTRKPRLDGSGQQACRHQVSKCRLNLRVVKLMMSFNRSLHNKLEGSRLKGGEGGPASSLAANRRSGCGCGGGGSACEGAGRARAARGNREKVAESSCCSSDSSSWSFSSCKRLHNKSKMVTRDSGKEWSPAATRKTTTRKKTTTNTNTRTLKTMVRCLNLTKLLALAIILSVMLNANKNHHQHYQGEEDRNKPDSDSSIRYTLFALASESRLPYQRANLRAMSSPSAFTSLNEKEEKEENKRDISSRPIYARSSGSSTEQPVIYVKVGALLEESDHEQANMFIRTIKMINERKDDIIRRLLNSSPNLEDSSGSTSSRAAAPSGGGGGLRSTTINRRFREEASDLREFSKKFTGDQKKTDFKTTNVASVKLEPMIEFLNNRESSLEADGRVCQLIESGANAIIGPKDGSSIQHVQSICDNIEIPYFELRPFLNSPPAVISASNLGPHLQSPPTSDNSQYQGFKFMMTNLSSSQNNNQDFASIQINNNFQQNQFNQQTNNQLEQLTLNLYPPAYLLTSAYIDLIYAWNWTSFAIVYEHGSSMIKLQDLFRESSGTWTSKWQIKLFQFNPEAAAAAAAAAASAQDTKPSASQIQEDPNGEPGDFQQNSNNNNNNNNNNNDNNNNNNKLELEVPIDIQAVNSDRKGANVKAKLKQATSFRDIFWQIKSIGETNIILDVNTEHLSEALKNAQQVGCMTERYSYLVTSLDLHTLDLEDFKYSRTRITAFNMLQAQRDPPEVRPTKPKGASIAEDDDYDGGMYSSPLENIRFHERYLEKLGVHVLKAPSHNNLKTRMATPSGDKTNHNKQAFSNIKWYLEQDKRLSQNDPENGTKSNELFQGADWSKREQLISSPASMSLLPSLDRDNEQKLFEFFVQQQENECLAPKLRLTTASAIVHDSLLLYTLALNDLDPTGTLLGNSARYARSFNNENNESNRTLKPLTCAFGSQANWPHGSSLVNYMRRASFSGLTGKISFDQAGLRSDSKLDMMGMAPEIGLVKVGEWHSKWPGPSSKLNYNDPYRNADGEKKSYDELSRIFEKELKKYSQIVANKQPFAVPYNRLISSTATRGFAAHAAHKQPTQSRSTLWNGSGGFTGLLVNDIIFERLYREQTDQVDTLIVTSKLSQPYFMLKETPNKLDGNDQYEGFVVDLIHELSKLVNFKYRWREAADKKYGSKTIGPNGTFIWNGMIGEIVYGLADLAIVDLTITSQREEAVDFTLPFMNTGISILFKKPTTKVTTLFSFLSPFSSDVWAYVLAAYCGMSAILFFVGHLSPYEWADPNPCRHSMVLNQNSFDFQSCNGDLSEGDQLSAIASLSEPISANLKNQFSLLNSFWFTIGSLMQQGSDLTPRSMSTRTIAGIWYFFTLIMISSYTANLAAFLTVEKVVYPIENVRDLSQQSEIRYGCVESGSTCTFFSESQIDTYKKINEGMKRHRTYIRSNDEGQKRVEEGKFAFFMESASIEYIIERNCNLTQIGGLLDSKGYGLATSKKSRLRRPYRTLLSEGILHLQETGMLHTLKNRWWKERRGGGTCTDDGKGGGVTELSLANVGGVFVVLLGGLGISFLVAIAEFMWRSRRTGSSRDRMCEEMMGDLKFALACKRSTKPVKSQDLQSQRRALNGAPKGVRRQLARQQSSLVSSQSFNLQPSSQQQQQQQQMQKEATGNGHSKSNHINQKLTPSPSARLDPALLGTREAVSKYGKDCDPILVHAMLTMLMQQQQQAEYLPNNHQQAMPLEIGSANNTAQTNAMKRRLNLLTAQQRIEVVNDSPDSSSNLNNNKYHHRENEVFSSSRNDLRKPI